MTDHTTSLDNILDDLEPNDFDAENELQLEAECNSPGITIVDEIIKKAMQYQYEALSLTNSTDCHIQVYARWQGRWIEARDFHIPHPLKNTIIGRLKIMAQLDISERRIPQFGSIRFKDEHNHVTEITVATLPGFYGEDITLRFRASNRQDMSYHDLLLPSAIHASISTVANGPPGLFVAAGPTGSGRMTSLYAIAQEYFANKRVIVIDESVRNNYFRTSFMRVNAMIGLTHELAIRTAIRHQPDVIICNDIHSCDAAMLAVNAAVSGIWVLTRLCVSNATDALLRLLNMGIEPFLLASAFRVSMTQRLVRTLCKECKPLIQSDHNMPIGCNNCQYTGYASQRGVYQLLGHNVAIKDAIAQFENKSGYDHLQTVCRHVISSSLQTEALHLVGSGITTKQEALQQTLMT